MKTDNEITRLRQARDDTQQALSDARRSLSAAQTAYVEAMETKQLMKGTRP